MRVLAGILAALILLIQYPLWLGKGGWLRAWEVDRRLGAQREANTGLENRNRALGAEVRDLKQGFEAIEERARYELGFVKQDEVFFQVIEAPKPPSAPTAPAGPVEK
jgi:cell division protein FtsB